MIIEKELQSFLNIWSNREMYCKLIISFYMLLSIANMTHLVGYRPQIYLQGIPQNIQSHDIQRLDMQQQSLKLPDTELYSIPSHDNQLQGSEKLCSGCKISINCSGKKCVPMRTRKPIVTTPSPLSTQRPVLTRPRLLADCPCPCHVSRQCRICQPCQESFI
ncbi:Major microfilarial sheath protein [Dirofilaria immitis]